MKMQQLAALLAVLNGYSALAQEVLWDTQFGDSDYNLDVDGDVRVLAVYDGELYAAGNFATAGGVTVNNIARFDGTSWSDVDGGLAFESVGNATVRGMAVANGELFVSGDIETAGTTSVYNVARWDGMSWADASDGLPSSMDPDDVVTFGLFSFESVVGDRLVLAWLDGSASEFYVYEWSASMESWSQLGADGFGVVGYVGPQAFAMYDGYLYAFPASCDTTFTYCFEGIARLPLSSPSAPWEATLAGVPEGPQYGPLDAVEFGGDLFIAGEGATAGIDTYGPLQSWDGLAYTNEIDAGFGYNYFAAAVWGGCSSDTLYVGGNTIASGLNVQVLGTGGWAVPVAGAIDAVVHDIVVYDGDLYFGGTAGFAGLNDINGVARLSCRCPSDWNGDGSTDSNDSLAYLNDYGNMDPSADLHPPGNPDGVFDSSDFLAFLNLGC